MSTTPLRRVVYQVASSLDGFIATEDGGYDWIPMDPDIDFTALVARFDTLVMGRLTYDVMLRHEGGVSEGGVYGKPTIVFSRTLDPAAHPNVTVTAEDPAAVVARLKREPGGDIWLFGGGALFRQLADAHLVDVVEIAVIPVLLGSGIPLMPRGNRMKLALRASQLYSGTGTVLLTYDVVPAANTPG
ncbi:dihydrofolate reductase [Luteitalea sp. TBR-22]|uniref:dihydrofolate reductase family protein n=1 Tax=Luteitalea sp. TBR-22 TaxID=2802971 RepID=UPI001AF76E8A|nr:dihydrofolate reductase family protein [Luteitalea sp. TBR-22]BCS30871.1 dihydrofolate reductase [Luteitalea sp. TBR-22]